MLNIERLRLLNQLKFVTSKSPFLELATQDFSKNSEYIQSALQITAFEQNYVLQCHDFQFMQLFQDFRDLDPNTTDPLLLMGILELFLSGLLAKGSAVVHSELSISEYLLNFKADEYCDQISFYLKFKNHKFACVLYIKEPSGRKALLQVLDELVSANPQWLETTLQNKLDLANAPADTSSAVLTLNLSLRLGWTILPLSSLQRLKIGDAIVLDQANFKQNLLEVVCQNLGCMAQVDFAQRSLFLMDDFRPVQGLHAQVATQVSVNQVPQSEVNAMAQDNTPQQESADVSQNDEAQVATNVATLPLSSLNDLQLELSFELERRNIKLQDLKSLVKGSVLPLQNTDLSNVAVLVNNQVVARGEIVDLDSSCALQITEICKFD